MIKKASLLISVVGMVTVMTLTGTAFAATGGDAAAGKEKAAMCGGCHGDDGNSFVADFPRLAGQYEAYIVKQVRDFQSGNRANNDTMSGMAMTVASVQDAKDIGAYFQSQKMVKDPLEKVNKKLVDQGENIFINGNPSTGVYACVNCHGERGKGKAKTISQFPVIGGQHRDYLIKNLTDFKEGRRSNDPAGMMNAIAKNLTDKEIKALAEYLSSQLP
jgi:cytochrome c553